MQHAGSNLANAYAAPGYAVDAPVFDA